MGQIMVYKPSGQCAVIYTSTKQLWKYKNKAHERSDCTVLIKKLLRIIKAPREMFTGCFAFSKTVILPYCDKQNNI